MRAHELDPIINKSDVANAYLRAGRFDEAAEFARRAVEVDREDARCHATLAWALCEQAKDGYVSPYHLAYVHTGLGQYDDAMDCLDQAATERSGSIYGIKGSFLFKPLHGHPRFEALLRRMHLG